jgi:hypothetical protein
MLTPMTLIQSGTSIVHRFYTKFLNHKLLQLFSRNLHSIEAPLIICSHEMYETRLCARAKNRVQREQSG